MNKDPGLTGHDIKYSDTINTLNGNISGVQHSNRLCIINNKLHRMYMYEINVFPNGKNRENTSNGVQFLYIQHKKCVDCISLYSGTCM